VLPADDTSAAAWVVAGVRGFAQSVLSLVPAGFEAYVRLFHPAYRARDLTERVRWGQIAEANGKHAHPGMQLLALTGSEEYVRYGQPGVYEVAPEEGSLPRELARPLLSVLERHTTTPEDCWFAIWCGFAGLRPGVARAPTFGLPAREYHLVHGPLEAAAGSAVDGRHQSPNLWWPQDRAWLVATEIDLNTTYLGCERACRAELLASPDLEATAVPTAARVDWYGDGLNPVPDNAP